MHALRFVSLDSPPTAHPQFRYIRSSQWRQGMLHGVGHSVSYGELAIRIVH